MFFKGFRNLPDVCTFGPQDAMFVNIWNVHKRSRRTQGASLRMHMCVESSQGASLGVMCFFMSNASCVDKDSLEMWHAWVWNIDGFKDSLQQTKESFRTYWWVPSDSCSVVSTICKFMRSIIFPNVVEEQHSCKSVLCLVNIAFLPIWHHVSLTKTNAMKYVLNDLFRFCVYLQVLFHVYQGFKNSWQVFTFDYKLAIFVKHECSGIDPGGPRGIIECRGLRSRRRYVGWGVY